MQSIFLKRSDLTICNRTIQYVVIVSLFFLSFVHTFAYAEDTRTTVTINGKDYSSYGYSEIEYGILSKFSRVDDPEYWEKLNDFYEEILDTRKKNECRPEVLEGFKDIDELRAYYKSSFFHPSEKVREFFKDTIIVQISRKHKMSLFVNNILSTIHRSISNEDRYRYWAASKKRSSIIPHSSLSKVIIHSAESNRPENFFQFKPGQDMALFSYCSIDMPIDEKRYILIRPLMDLSVDEKPGKGNTIRKIDAYYRTFELVVPQEGSYKDPFFEYVKKHMEHK